MFVFRIVFNKKAFRNYVFSPFWRLILFEPAFYYNWAISDGRYSIGSTSSFVGASCSIGGISGTGTGIADAKFLLAAEYYCVSYFQQYYSSTSFLILLGPDNSSSCVLFLCTLGWTSEDYTGVWSGLVCTVEHQTNSLPQVATKGVQCVCVCARVSKVS